MDDLFKFVLSLLEACRLQAGLTNLHSLSGFRLTKWISSNKDLRKMIPEGERAKVSASYWRRYSRFRETVANLVARPERHFLV